MKALRLLLVICGILLLRNLSYAGLLETIDGYRENFLCDVVKVMEVENSDISFLEVDSLNPRQFVYKTGPYLLKVDYLGLNHISITSGEKKFWAVGPIVWNKTVIISWPSSMRHMRCIEIPEIRVMKYWKNGVQRFKLDMLFRSGNQLLNISTPYRFEREAEITVSKPIFKKGKSGQTLPPHPELTYIDTIHTRIGNPFIKVFLNFDKDLNFSYCNTITDTTIRKIGESLFRKNDEFKFKLEEPELMKVVIDSIITTKLTKQTFKELKDKYDVYPRPWK